MEHFIRRLARDPVCGQFVDEKTAVHAARGGKEHAFCSRQCLESFSRETPYIQ